MNAKYQSFDLQVPGGRLHGAQWGRSGPVVLASHGLTASHIEFEALADQLGDGYRIVAIDHRGRGKSRGIEGPFGLDAHAADLLAAMDHLGIGRADVLVGHSMGAFVAAVAGAQHPDRFPRLLFIDGGLPAFDAPPPGVTVEQLILAVLGPSIQRLDMRFASGEDYREFWRAHPAFLKEPPHYLDRYADYDLVGTPPDLHSSSRKEAIVRDVETQLAGDLIPQSLMKLKQPVRFLKAPRGVMDGAPLYADSVIELWATRIANFSHTTIEDVNHFTIAISERGARALAQEVRALLS